jgi:hypothetical protein
MKTIFASLLFSIASTFLFGQSYNLDVINGYGSGTYAAGDTVDIWSVAFMTGIILNAGQEIPPC